MRIHFKQNVFPFRRHYPVRGAVLKAHHPHESAEFNSGRFRQDVRAVRDPLTMSSPIVRLGSRPPLVIDTDCRVVIANRGDADLVGWLNQDLELARRLGDGHLVRKVFICQTCSEDPFAFPSLCQGSDQWRVQRFVDEVRFGSKFLPPAPDFACMITYNGGCERHAAAQYAFVLPQFYGGSPSRVHFVDPFERMDEFQGTTKRLLHLAECELSMRPMEIVAQSRLAKAAKPGERALVEFPAPLTFVQDNPGTAAWSDGERQFPRVAVDIETTHLEAVRQMSQNRLDVAVYRRPDDKEVRTPGVTQVSASSVSLRYVCVSSSPILLLLVGNGEASSRTANFAAKRCVDPVLSEGSNTVSVLMALPSCLFRTGPPDGADRTKDVALCDPAQGQQLQLPLDFGDFGLSRLIGALYREDQSDRTLDLHGGLRGVGLDVRDDRRAALVRRLARNPDRLSGDASYQAAMILQHGPTWRYVADARRCALRAAYSGIPGAHFLAAATLDRRLMYQGRPQCFGTQYRRMNGRWKLWPVRRSTSDDMRRKWKVPSLDEAHELARSWDTLVQH